MISQIVTRTHETMRILRQRLEVEERGPEVASIQGQLVGLKNFLGHMVHAFHLSAILLEDTGDIPVKVADITDDQLVKALHEAERIQKTEEWKSLLGRIEADIEDIKHHLVYDATQARELHLGQGTRKGLLDYKEFFTSLYNEQSRRKELAMEPDLPFEKPADKTDETGLVVRRFGAIATI